jgi:beta-lactam-binding protein with PASTA domain/serine/threonine protein kinase
VDLGISGLGYATEIGAGASAIVYKARQLDLDREVAVKVLSVTDEAFVRRFRREAKTLGKLSQNPGIVTVYDTGVTGAGQPYLILELCSSSVLDHLNNVGVFDPMVACQAASQVADAVGNAHENGVVHRDIKPGNVLVSQTGRYMVTDFGISTVTGATMGQTNSVGFTAGYVAPETLTGEPVGTPSDVYALGATLFHMIAGQAPFVADTEQSSNLLALAQRVVNDPVPDLRTQGIPDQVCDVIEAAMAKKPEDRPTAPELRDRLLAVAGEPAAPALSGAPMFGLNNETVAGGDEGVPASIAWAAPDADATQISMDSATDATIGMEPVQAPASDATISEPDVGAGLFQEPPAGRPLPPTPQPPSPQPPSPQPPAGDRSILDGSTRSPAPPTPEERRYLYTEDDRRQLGPLIVGALIGLIALVGVGGYLITRGDGSDTTEDTSALEAVDGPTSSVAASGNEATDQDDGLGGRGNLDGTSSSTSTSIDTAVINIAMPDVSGMSAAAAAAELTNVGLVVNQVDEESATVPVGTVIRQSPSAGASVPSGEVVSIYVSAAGTIETIDVPVVAGLTLVDARAALTAAGLTATVTRETSPTVAEDAVISSSPEAGTTVNVDSAVALVVSDGPASTRCADATGMTEAAATTALEAAGFTVTSTLQPSSTVANGLVISCTETTPTAASLTVSSGVDHCDSLVGMTRAAASASLVGAGLTVTETATISETVAANQVLTCTVTGTTATITYAVAAPAVCPPVTGDTVPVARAALTAAGFADIQREEAASETVAAGMVISCAVTGATATITVSTGPPNLVVPDVGGMTTAAGSNALTTAGFVVGTIQEVASALPAGEIIRTTPVAGTAVTPGSTINLVVSDGGVVTVAVPNVVGDTQAVAVAAINAAGLTPTVVTQPVAAGSPSIGTVLSITPAAGTMVAVNSSVTLTVAVAGP